MATGPRTGCLAVRWQRPAAPWSPDHLPFKMPPPVSKRAQLDKLPVMPGSPRCFNLVGSGRVCLIHAVLGTSLLNNSQVRRRMAPRRAGRCRAAPRSSLL